jgi:hypothetical protein
LSPTFRVSRAENEFTDSALLTFTPS